MPRLDAIGVIVSDMGRAMEFYRLVGLEFAETPTKCTQRRLGRGADLRRRLEEVAAPYQLPDGRIRFEVAFRHVSAKPNG